MTSLYTVNIKIMKGPMQVSMSGKSVFALVESWIGENKYSFETIITVLILLGIFVFLLILFFKTEMGVSIRATGDNEDMVRASGINTDLMKIIAFAMANGFIGLSGALFAQEAMSAEVNMGNGMVIAGLASLIIGEVVLGKKSVTINIFSVIIGSVLYRIIEGLVLNMNIDINNFKLISSLIVILAISYPIIKAKIQFWMDKKRRLSDAANYKS